MYASEQNITEHLSDQVSLGLITPDEANVKLVQMVGVKVVTNSIPRATRAALERAVKSGEIGKLKKDGAKPLIYHNIHARGRAIALQREIAAAAYKAVLSVVTPD